MARMHGRNVLERRVYSCWAIVQPAPDVAGKWVAHCLDFDTLSQADDAETATKLLIEMTKDMVIEDLYEGKNPEDRRAPDEDWAIVEQLVDASAYSSFAEVNEKIGAPSDDSTERGRWVIGCQFILVFERHRLPERKAKPFFPLRARKIRMISEPTFA